VQGLPSFAVKTQPVVGLQPSSVQEFWSLQTMAGFSHAPVNVLHVFDVQAFASSHDGGGSARQAPLTQASLAVQAFPSLQTVPSGFAGLEQPVCESHVPATWH
jgi:hypothetical protein